MKKFLVKITRTETFVHEQVVEAANEDEAKYMVENDEGWEYPDDPDYVEAECEVEEVAA